MNANSPLSQAPIECPEKVVLPEWIDYNGHMNMAFYHVVFDQAVDHFFDALGIGAGYVERQGGSMFSREVHVNYLSEATLGERLLVTLQLLDWDAKRLHFFEHMYNAESSVLVATSEQLALHVDMASRRTAPLPEFAQQKLRAFKDLHSTLATPNQVGHRIGIPST